MHHSSDLVPLVPKVNGPAQHKFGLESHSSPELECPAARLVVVVAADAAAA